MVTMICQLEMLIREANSLKDKRSVIKSIIERTKKKYFISIIESNFHEYWKKSEVSFTFCSMELKDGQHKLEKIIAFIESNPYIEVYEVNKEEVHL